MIYRTKRKKKVDGKEKETQKRKGERIGNRKPKNY